MERTYTTPLLDKLGIRPGMRVGLAGFGPAVLDDELTGLTARTSDITLGEPRDGTDVVLFAAESPAELESLARLRGSIKPNGAIWIVSRKGKAATLRYAELLEAARAAGLVDNKVASFSATHTALRFVIPVALRPR